MSFPSRLLVPGLDFPCPTLSTVTFRRLGDPYYLPTIANIPPVFSVNRESRLCCLETYVPFAYSYLHPSLDTLYLATGLSRAFLRKCGFYDNDCCYASLYPLAMLDRIIVGYRPSQQWHSIIFLFSALDLLGSPREITFVENDEGLEEDRTLWEYGVSRVELISKPIEISAFVSYREKASYRRHPLRTRKLRQICDGWLNWRPPLISVIRMEPFEDPRVAAAYDATKRGILEIRDLKHMEEAADRVGSEWKEDVLSTTNSEASSDIYALENTKKALARTRYLGKVPW